VQVTTIYNNLAYDLFSMKTHSLYEKAIEFIKSAVFTDPIKNSSSP
jgi:hypothetical protein